MQYEPMLGKTWYVSFEKQENLSDLLVEKDLRTAIMWVLHSSNGKNSLEDIVRLSGLEIKLVKNAVDLCIENDLIFESLL